MTKVGRCPLGLDAHHPNPIQGSVGGLVPSQGWAVWVGAAAVEVLTRRAPSKRRFQYDCCMSSTRTSEPLRGEWMNLPSPT